MLVSSAPKTSLYVFLTVQPLYELLGLTAFVSQGLGIGPERVTIPMHAAECTPADIWGALVMMVSWLLFLDVLSRTLIYLFQFRVAGVVLKTEDIFQ